jgi:hypothetical protein
MALYPNVLTHINLERTRVQGWEVGEEWSRFGWLFDRGSWQLSRSSRRLIVYFDQTCLHVLESLHITTWQVRAAFTGDECMAYAASRHIVRADTRGVLSWWRPPPSYCCGLATNRRASPTYIIMHACACTIMLACRSTTKVALGS